VIGREFAPRILQAITGTGEELKDELAALQELGSSAKNSRCRSPHTSSNTPSPRRCLRKPAPYPAKGDPREDRNGDGDHLRRPSGGALRDAGVPLLEERKPGKGSPVLRLAADKAKAAYANREAVSFYGSAIRVLERLPDTDENKRIRVDVYRSMNDPFHDLGYPRESLFVLRQGEELSRVLGDERSTAHFRMFLGAYHGLNGELLCARAHMRSPWKRP